MMSTPRRLRLALSTPSHMPWEVSPRRAEPFGVSCCWLFMGWEPEGMQEFFWAVVDWSGDLRASPELWGGSSPIARFGKRVS